MYLIMSKSRVLVLVFCFRLDWGGERSVFDFADASKRKRFCVQVLQAASGLMVLLIHSIIHRNYINQLES